MKKIISFLSFSVAALFLTACGDAGADSSVSEAVTKQWGYTSGTEESSGKVTDAKADDNENSEEGKNVLVAYFSATGTTERIAEAIAAEAGAELYEITPAVPYSDDDLNYNDDDCRANREQNDKDFRTEIAGTIEGFGDYDTVFIGYPIWWGEEPRIIDTFMETYDLSGKTAIPFCTSGGSGIATSESDLREMCPGAHWLGGKRFSDDSEVPGWVEELIN